MPSFFDTMRKKLSCYYDKLGIGILVIDENLNIVFSNLWVIKHLKEDRIIESNLSKYTKKRIYKMLSVFIPMIIKKRTFQILSQAIHGWIIPLPDKRFDDGCMPQSCLLSPFEWRGCSFAMIQIKDESDTVLRIKKLRNKQSELLKINVDLKQLTEELSAENQKRMEVEKELIAAIDEANSASRAKSQFLDNMSHEIRTPMNAIIGMSHLALQMDLDEKTRTTISKVNRSAVSLMGTLNDILDFSKIESGKLRLEIVNFCLADVIQTLFNTLRLKSDKKGLELRGHIEPDVPNSLIGDPLRVGQILSNLCNNAVKFTEPGGEILVSISMVDAGQSDRIKLLFSVQDSGIGMSMEERTRLFEPFSQADTSITRQYGGTGLGLAISKQLTELMDGDIWVESHPGVGSTFYFTVRLGKQATSSASDRCDDRGLHIGRSLEPAGDGSHPLGGPGELRDEKNAISIGNDAITAQTIDSAEIEPLITQLAAYLADSDIQSLEVVSQLTLLLKQTNCTNEISAVANAIEGYDFEKAENELQLLASKLGLSISP